MLGHALGHAVITWASPLREARLVMGVVTTATHGQTRLRGPFSKKQLIKTTWRRSVNFSVTETLATRAYGVGPFERNWSLYPNSSCLLSPPSVLRKRQGTESEGVHPLQQGGDSDSTGFLFAFVNIWRLQNIIHISVKPETWISPQIKWLSV